MKRYDDLTEWSLPAAKVREVPPGAEIETHTPIRPANLGSDLAVPLGQALVTGGLLAALLVFAFTQFVPSSDGNPLLAWLGLTIAISAVTWLLLLHDTRKLLWALERIVGEDLNGDQQVGQPRDRIVFVNRDQARQQTAKERRADEWLKFRRFVEALDHRGTGYDAWESALGRGTYVEYRDALIDYGLARWRSYRDDGRANTTQGWELLQSAADTLRLMVPD